ncbi:MAG: replicative DNA helicase [Candidatus Brennerbacteria bacterium RIFOXYC1_FULL_41_11]|uniref:Replicative DNA helicase n=1 Tax=Candidatus Brennerbacteria bacterium RIFOXYD1_FULL_41_16 TaxID=1797529 RepID=A0A1G1XJU8_9BACT|nr:MAG: replicative DNA helicase [Candidatus Brennerbacteria bacterium RIFOXYC1_FULL_41_11]OGY40231.1 MAG: replicative DNA helicase [Candidatus Brennerbacteria bacterium RIFOXYD1_FULL_41_16]
MPKRKNEIKNLNDLAGKLPPQDIEAEQSVLGAIMIDRNSLAKVADVLLPEDFYRPNHQKIYSVMIELFSRSEPIDILTVSSRLKEKKELEEIGGVSYLSELVNLVPTSSHIDHYSKIVNKKRVLRDLIGASYNISELAQEEKRDVEDILDSAEQEIFKISQRTSGKGFQHITEDLKKAFERIEELHHHRGKLRGITTGFKSLDNVLSGLQRSDLVILAARPSIGKSSFALDIARNAALSEKVPVGIFSIEMSRDQIIDRLVAAEANVDLWKIRTGNLSEKGEPNDFELLQEAMAKLDEAPIYIVDVATPTVIQIRAMARRLQAEVNLGLLIVDYLQLINSTGKSDNLVQQMTEISRGLKALARELNIPILAISQLSRAVEQRPHQIPRLSDLRDSGSIEQDADVVMFIYREDKVKEETNKHNIADLIIAKHRNGPVGKVTFHFSEQFASFRELTKEEGLEMGTSDSEEF